MGLFIRGFFCVLGVCILIAAGGWLRNLFSPLRTGRAVLLRRERKVFPLTLGVQRNRFEYRLVFSLPEQGRELTFSVGRETYEGLTAGMVGTLAWRGGWFRSFRTAEPTGGQAPCPRQEQQ